MATSPTSPPTASTANGSTTIMTRSPRIESTWPVNSSRYCGSSRSTAGSRGRRRPARGGPAAGVVVMAPGSVTASPVRARHGDRSRRPRGASARPVRITEEAAVQDRTPRPGHPRPGRAGLGRRAAGAAARAAAVVAAARLRQRAALPGGVRRGRRAPGRLPGAGRPGPVPVHHQGGPARQLPVRHVRGAARAGVAGARVVRHDGPADRRRLHRRGHRDLGDA